jgi:hypothetical protein
VLRQTMRRRWQAKLHEVKTELRRRLHASIPAQGAYVRSVVVGHTRYYGVPRNGPSLTRVSRRPRAALAQHADASEPDRVRVVGAHAPLEGALAPWAAHLSSLPPPALGVCYPRQEPDA